MMGMSMSLVARMRGGFNPSRLFSNGEPGAWFEANDANTLFTDVAGTTPVTAPGDAVALQLDKSQGLTLGPELSPGTSSTAGWTSYASPVSFTSDGSSLTLVADSVGDGFLLPGLTIGKSYEIISSGSGSSFRWQQEGGGNIYRAGHGKAIFVAASTDLLMRASAAGTYIFDNISVRELPGNHRTQATTAARPLYALQPVGGVRNLLVYTEEFDNAVWVKNNATVTANAAVAPDGVSFASALIPNTLNSSHNIPQIAANPNSILTLSVFAKANGYNWLRMNFNGSSGQCFFDLENGTVGTALSDATIEDYGNGWFRCSMSSTAISNATVAVNVANSDGGVVFSGDGTSSILIYGTQFEEGSTATNYQRVGSFLDVSEEGKARRGRLWYNGTSHFMETGTITPGTDKVQVFAGVRKLRNNAQEAVLELNNFAEAGLSVQTLTTFAPWRFGSRGDAAPSIADATSNTFPSPVSSIITGLGDISGDSAILRVDGVQEAISTADQGAGNYATSQLRFGARAGTSLFYNGYEDTSIIRFGPNLDADTISKVESYVASKTPEPTL